MLIDPGLRALSDADLEARRRAVLDALLRRQKDGAADAELRAAYRAELLPLEAERIRRAGLAEEPVDLLFVTVGAQADTPALAILGTPARNVVLLHTEGNEALAREAALLAGLGPDVSWVPRSVGDGRQARELYRVVIREWEGAGRPRKVAVDLTGGYKAMSAAAQAVATQLGASVRYVEADQKTLRGSWVDERVITLDDPLLELGVLERRRGVELLRGCHWYAAWRLFDELFERTAERTDRLRARLAKGFFEIESLAFQQAAGTLDRARADAAAQSAVAPALLAHVDALREGVRRLAEVLPQRDQDDARLDFRDERIRDVIEFLVASAERRLRLGENDVAALLAYRAIELVAQRRFHLLTGQLARAVQWEDLARSHGITLEELKQRYDRLDPRNPLELGRLPPRIGLDMLCRLLAVLASQDVFDRATALKVRNLAEARNNGVFAHGLRRTDEKAAEELVRCAHELRDRMLEREGVPDAERAALRDRHRFPDPELFADDLPAQRST